MLLFFSRGTHLGGDARICCMGDEGGTKNKEVDMPPKGGSSKRKATSDEKCVWSIQSRFRATQQKSTSPDTPLFPRALVIDSLADFAVFDLDDISFENVYKTLLRIKVSKRAEHTTTSSIVPRCYCGGSFVIDHHEAMEICSMCGCVRCQSLFSPVQFSYNFDEDDDVELQLLHHWNHYIGATTEQVSEALAIIKSVKLNTFNTSHIVASLIFVCIQDSFPDEKALRSSIGTGSLPSINCGIAQRPQYTCASCSKKHFIAKDARWCCKLTIGKKKGVKA